MDDKTKASVVKACYDTAQDEAKALVSDYTPDGLTKQIAEAQQHGISAAEYILFYKITGEMKTKKDSSGKVVENKAGQVREWLKDSGLPQSHKEYLWSTQYKEAY